MSDSLGDVKITLDGADATLRCTVRAWKDISATFDSFTDAFRKIAAFNAPAYVAVIAAGLGKSRADVEGAVFRTGMPSLTGPLADYLSLLSNGGREPDAGAPKSGEA